MQAAAKKLLVVTTAAGFRHGSIPAAEKILAQPAHESGEFTVGFVRQPDGKPAPLKNGATPEEKGDFQYG